MEESVSQALEHFNQLNALKATIVPSKPLVKPSSTTHALKDFFVDLELVGQRKHVITVPKPISAHLAQALTTMLRIIRRMTTGKMTHLQGAREEQDKMARTPRHPFYSVLSIQITNLQLLLLTSAATTYQLSNKKL